MKLYTPKIKKSLSVKFGWNSYAAEFMGIDKCTYQKMFSFNLWIIKGGVFIKSKTVWR